MFGRQCVLFSSVVLGCATFVSLSAPSSQTLRAQDAAAGTASVARLSLGDGEVHVSAAGYAALNMPLAAGQSLQTGANADAEIEFPDGSVLRSAASSSATLIRLQPQTEIGLDEGLYYLELRAGADAQFVVYAGDLSITPKENASFRVRVQNGEPEIAVLRGSVSVTHQNSYTVDIEHGESLRTDAKDARRYLLADTIGPESADLWNERRAQQVADASAAQTVARDDFAGGQGYGWSDLDSSGAWYPLPGEGLVWQPYGVDASFDPYAYGSWISSGFGGGGGYTWASGYAWGWLPYHCGSWGYYQSFGWGWQPAAGCRSYGGGWPVSGFPVRHPPRGWHGPVPPRATGPGGIVTRRPTPPGSPFHGTINMAANRPHAAQPIQLNGMTLKPLSPVAAAPTPRGSSAVGSALRRDFPLQDGTHQPLFGLESNAVTAMPGRAPEWRMPSAVATRVESRGEPRVSEKAQPGSAFVAGEGHTDAAGAALSTPAGALSGQTFATGWHSRVQSVPPAASRPAGAGAAVSAPGGVRSPSPGSASVPASSTGARTPVVAPVSVRPVVVAPVQPRVVSPTPVAPRVSAPPPAPHFNMPSAPPAVHTSSPSSSAPAASRPR